MAHRSNGLSLMAITMKAVSPGSVFALASLGFAQNVGSGGEAEGLHLVRVLLLCEEFREDVALGDIQEKFGQSLA